MANEILTSVLKFGSTTYTLKDAWARDKIEEIESALTGGIVFRGETTTPLTDSATTNPIVINGNSYTAVRGDLVVYSDKEFVFDGTKWIELGGNLSLLGDLAWKDDASGSYTPAGTVSQPSFTGSETTSTGNFTPAGSVSKPSITVTPTTDSVYSITDVGTLPELTTSYDSANETLTIGFSQGSLPTKGSAQTVMTAASAALDNDPVFTGTQGSVSVTGTPSGTVSQPTFTGTAATITVS